MPTIDTLGNFNIRGVARPLNADEAANRAYVDAQIQASGISMYTDAEQTIALNDGTITEGSLWYNSSDFTIKYYTDDTVTLATTAQIDNLPVPIFQERNVQTFGPEGFLLSNTNPVQLTSLTGNFDNTDPLLLEVEASTLHGSNVDEVPPGTIDLLIRDTSLATLATITDAITLSPNGTIEPQLVSVNLTDAQAAQTLTFAVRWPAGTTIDRYGWTDFQVIAGQVTPFDDLARTFLREELGVGELDGSRYVTQDFYSENTGITVHHAATGIPVSTDFSGTSGNTRDGNLVIATAGDYTIATTIEITSVISNFGQGQWRITLTGTEGVVATRNISVNSDQGIVTKNLTVNGLTAQTYTLTVALQTHNNINGWAVQARATINDHNSVDVDPLVYTDLDTRYLQSTDLSPYRALTDQALGTVPYRSPFNSGEWSSIVQPGAFDRPIVLEDAVEIEVFPTVGDTTTSGFSSFGAVLAANGTNPVVLADSGFLSGDDDVYDVYTLGTTAQLVFYLGASNSISVGERVDIVQNDQQNTAITTDFSVADFIVDSVQTIGDFQRVVADSTRDARVATAPTINADLGSGVAGIDSFLTAQGIPVVRFVATASIDTDGGETLAGAYLQSYIVHEGLTRFGIPLAIRDEDYNRVDRVDSLVFDDNPVPRRITDALAADDANLSNRIDQLEGSGTLGPTGEDGLSYLVLYNNNADDNPPNQPESRVTGSDLWESTNQGRVETNTFTFTGDQTGGRWHAAGYTPVAETNELTFSGSTLGSVTTPGTADQPNMVEINFSGRGGSTSVTTPIAAQPEITDLTFSGTSSFYPSGNPFRPGLFDATLLDITGSEGMWVSTGGLRDNGSRHTLALSSLARPTGDPAGQTRFLFDKTTQGAAAYYANNGPHGFLGSNVIHNIISHINTNTVDNDGVLFTTEEKAQAALFTDTTDGFTPFRSDAGGVSTDWVMQAHCWPVNNYIRIGLTGLHNFEDAPDVRFIDAAATLYVALMIVKYNLRSTATTTFNGVTVNGIFDWADAVSEYNTLEAPSWDADTETLRFASTDDTRENAGWTIANGQLVSSDTTGTTQSGSVTTRNITLTSLQEPSGAASNTNAVTANHVVTFNSGYLWLANDVTDDTQDSVFFEFVNNLGYKSITPAFTVFDTNTSETTYSPVEAAAVIRGKLAAWLAEQTQIDFFRGDTPTLAFGTGETYFQVLIDNPTDSTLMAVGVSRQRSAAEFEGHVVEEALSLSVELNGLVNGAILNDANRGSIQIANLLFDELAVTYSEYLVPLLSDASANTIAQYLGDRISGDSNISDTFATEVNDATIRLTTLVDEPQGDMVLRVTGSSASSLTGSAVVIQQGSVGVATTDDGTVSSYTFSIDRDFHNQMLADDALPGAITNFTTDGNNITTYTIQNPANIRAEFLAINFRNFINAVFDGFDEVEFSFVDAENATVRLVSSQTVVSDATEVSPLVNITEPGTGGNLAATNAVTAGRAGTADVITGANPTLTLTIDPIHHSVGTLVIDLPPFASAEASANAVATYFIDNPQYEYAVSTVASTPNIVTLTSATPGAELDLVPMVFAGSLNDDSSSPGSLTVVNSITQGADSGSPIFDETGEGRIEFDALDQNHRTGATLVPYDLSLVGSRIGLRYLVDFVDTGDVTTEDLVVSWSYPATNRANTPTEIDVFGHINVASGTSLTDFTTTLIAELNASVVSNILVDVDLDDYILARTTQPAIGDLHLQALGTRVDLIGDELNDVPITGLTSSYSGVDFRVGTDNSFLKIQTGSFNDSPADDSASWTVQTYTVRDADDDTTTFADDAFVLNLDDGLFYRNETGDAAVFTTASYTAVDDWGGNTAYSVADFVAYRGNVYLNATATTSPTLGTPTDGPTLTAANDEPRIIVHPSVQTVLDDLAAQANNLTAVDNFGFRATTTSTELILAGVDREAEEDLEFTFNAPSNSNLAVDLSIEQGINPGTIDYWMPNYDTGSNWFIAIPNTDLNLDTVTAADWLSQAVVPVGGGGGAGTEVVANPIGLDGTDLTRIQIGGVNYVIPDAQEVNPNVPDAPADQVAATQYVLQTPVENTGASPEWVEFSSASFDDLDEGDIVAVDANGNAIAATGDDVLDIVDLLNNDQIRAFNEASTDALLVKHSSGQFATFLDRDQWAIGLGIDDLGGIPDRPTFPQVGNTPQQLTWRADLSMFQWVTATQSADVTTTVNVNSSTPLALRRQFTGGDSYTARLYDLQTGTAQSFEFNARRRTPDDTITVAVSVAVSAASAEDAITAFNAIDLAADVTYV